jgi:hypothetical protein
MFYGKRSFQCTKPPADSHMQPAINSRLSKHEADAHISQYFDRIATEYEIRVERYRCGSIVACSLAGSAVTWHRGLHEETTWPHPDCMCIQVLVGITSAI